MQRFMLMLTLANLISGLSVVHAGAAPVREGETVPDFALPTVDGKKTVRLSDYRGKKVILFMWASW